mgnify:CR=1 FL=1
MKIGLVVEGGASRTFYSCGVMDEMLRENIYADYVIGTSAGISMPYLMFQSRSAETI